ncbi:hypothetical protein BDB01DRAFT_846452 [Pilobolus umbonatus]|nr:hypothetical protein BDB01DRAFT_846452 [Pilobolus umbonatus]
MTSRGTEKTLQKLRQSVHDGKYYEAHQMYRTVARRYNKQEQYKSSIRLLHDGAILLLQHKQYGSGSDLANYMLETYKLVPIPVDEESLDRVVEILSLLPAKDAGRKQYISNAFRWATTNNESLHDYVGTLFYYEKNYTSAEEHLLQGTDHSAEILGKVAYDWAKQENAQWKGVYLARIVLQYLASKSIHHAHLAYNSFISAGPQPTAGESQVKKAPADSFTPVPVYNDPWINFIQLVLLTVQRDAAPLFTDLRSKYEELYDQEKNFVELLNDIGFIFFNIPKPKKQGNMIQEMMASLFSGGNQQKQLSGTSTNEDLD